MNFVSAGLLMGCLYALLAIGTYGLEMQLERKLESMHEPYVMYGVQMASRLVRVAACHYFPSLPEL